jgi:NTE family protein
MTSSKVALVIGSGGIKCAAAIGMWQVLKAEILPDLIVGCSGGSIYSALIARDADTDYMAERSRQVWTAEIMQGYTENLKATRGGSLRFTERSGLVDDAYLNEALEGVAFDMTFADLAIPLKLIATDMNTGEKVVLTEGRIRDAVRASLAIPIIFPPWEIDGRLLIDGGVSDPLPIDVAIQEGADIIIAMGFSLSYRKRLRSMTAVQEQLNSIYMNNILNATYGFYNLAHHAEIFPIMPEFEEPLSMFDVDKLPEIIEKGAEATRTQLPHIRRLMESMIE